uniref:Uncharacterized protein n=1 Tax=Panagrolaimus davidi TaxID=227884 RepID=A0A914QPK6_9BILA
MPTDPSRSFGLIGNVFLNKIYRNSLKELSINSGFTLFKELKILSKSPNLYKVELYSFVKNENDEPIPIVEIMVLFPNIKNFNICPPHFTMESFEKLLKFKFSNKFQKLRFGSIKNEFDPITFCTFLKENFDDDAEFSLIFHWNFRHLENQLLPRVKEIINGWETKKPK